MWSVSPRAWPPPHRPWTGKSHRGLHTPRVWDQPGCLGDSAAGTIYLDESARLVTQGPLRGGGGIHICKLTPYSVPGCRKGHPLILRNSSVKGWARRHLEATDLDSRLRRVDPVKFLVPVPPPISLSKITSKGDHAESEEQRSDDSGQVAHLLRSRYWSFLRGGKTRHSAV